MFYKTLLLMVGIIACSTSVIFIRESELGPIFLSAMRLLLASLFLAPLFISQQRKYRQYKLTRTIRFSLLPAGVLALHFISWNIGARMTPASNASLIVNLIPLAMPFLLYFMFREKITRTELIATMIAIAGLSWLGMNDFNIDQQYFQGDAVSFVSMILFAFYLALGRKNQHFESIWLYLVPMYFLAGLGCLIIAIITEPLKFNFSAYQILVVIGLAVVPTVIGHSILNYSMQQLRGQFVSILNISQFISAGIFAYFLYREIPSSGFVFSSVLIVIAVVMVIFGNKNNRDTLAALQNTAE